MNPTPKTQSLSLNGLEVAFSADSFHVWTHELPDPRDMRAIRQHNGQEWFLYWDSGRLYGVPRASAPSTRIGDEELIQCTDHLGLRILAARINDVLPSQFPKYEAFRHRPFSFLSLKDELVSASTHGWPQLPELLSGFTIRPRFELDPRLVEFRDGDTAVAVIVNVTTRWGITAPLDKLQAAGIDLTGLHVVRKNPTPDERRLVGRIARLNGPTVEFSVAYDAETSLPLTHIELEGSRAAFAHCLRVLLGARYDRFETARYEQEERFFTGPAYDRLLTKMEQLLGDCGQVPLTPEFSCRFGNRITFKNSDEYATFHVSSPIHFCFDPAKSKRSQYPWSGLDKFGPYSADTFQAKTPSILVVCPDSVQGQVDQFLRKLRDGMTSNPQSSYQGGLARTFHLVNPRFETCSVRITPGASPASAYKSAIQDYLAGNQRQFQAAIVVILNQHSNLPEKENPYLCARATLLLQSIPTQQVRLQTITAQDYALQYSLQNISTALYAKMGGVPWTVDQSLTVNDELVIGIGSAELSGNRFEKRQRHIGITTVFRGDGNYLLSSVSRESSYDDYPTVLRDSTAKILTDLKRRNGWQPHDVVRLVFHSFKPMKGVEVADIVRTASQAVASEQTIQFAFLTVSNDHAFKLLDPHQRGITRGGAKPKAVQVPERGTIAQLGRFTRLVCTNGPSLIKRPGSPLPAPLLVHLHKESDYRDLTYLSEQVLRFTALSWRSTLPAREPVTVYYSSLIADALGRLRAVPEWTPAVLEGKLRGSMWFL